MCVLYVLQIETSMSSRAPGAWLPVLPVAQLVYRFILKSDLPELTTDIVKISPEFEALRAMRDPLAGSALRL
jgi:hypothetical protein